MLPFALTIFLGAFLLFAVQPLLGRFILPWFGGSPSVWTTCMLFFQTLLLGGYLYAHLAATRLTARRQAVVHLVFIAAALAFLPIVPAEHWRPESAEAPVWRILLLLTVSVGLPYFVLSSTGPLIQQWFALVQPGRSPYRLYSLSNVGSLFALLGYPFLFERFFSRQEIAHYWAWGLAAYALASAWCAWRLWQHSRDAHVAPAPAVTTTTPRVESPVSDHQPDATPLDRLLWFSLAAVASILLLATTNKLSQDIAVIPFLWVLPLSLYLLSFILCFDHPRWYSRGLFGGLFALGALVDVYLLFAGHNAKLPQQVIGYVGTLFAGCMVCHGELYRLRPSTRQLTSFYLMIAAGGATGGMVVGLLAPLVFDRYLELHLGLWLLSYLIGVLAFRHRSLALTYATAAGALAATLAIPALKTAAARAEEPLAEFWSELKTLYVEHWTFVAFFAAGFLLGIVGRRGWVREWQARAGNFLMLFSVGLGVLLLVQIRRESADAVLTTRNFYGVLKVVEINEDFPDLHYRSLLHGVTSHGSQFTTPSRAAWPTTYYGQESGVGLAIENLPPQRAHHIGLVGLGTGTVALYGRANDRVRIYEIDPEVERIARTYFTFLDLSAAQVDVVLGDARLSMEREIERGEIQQFDVLALDAFSSDSIPIHLLTREAFAVYLQHLKPDGVLAIHTSNRYLDLQPVVERLARDFGLETVTIWNSPDKDDWWLYGSTWVLVSRNEDLLGSDEIARHADFPSDREGPLWTDDHASIFEVLK